MSKARAEQTHVGAVGEAGSIPLRTGDWALSHPVIDAGRCNLCLLCWVFCPEGTIVRRHEGEVETTPTVDYSYCKGCGICERECPRGAVAMVGR